MAAVHHNKVPGADGGSACWRSAKVSAAQDVACELAHVTRKRVVPAKNDAHNPRDVRNSHGGHLDMPTGNVYEQSRLKPTIPEQKARHIKKQMCCILHFAAPGGGLGVCRGPAPKGSGRLPALWGPRGFCGLL